MMHFQAYRSEHINLNELFEQMTTVELEAYARDGSLPQWFMGVAGATTGSADKTRLTVESRQSIGGMLAITDVSGAS